MKLSEFAAQKDDKKIKTEKIPSIDENDLNKKYEEIKDLPQDELYKMLQDEILRQKRAGEFDYMALKNMVEQIKTFLPQDTYENIIKMVESFKWQKSIGDFLILSLVCPMTEKRGVLFISKKKNL